MSVDVRLDLPLFAVLPVRRHGGRVHATVDKGQMTGMFGITYAPGGTRPAFANHVDNIVFDAR